MDMVMASGNMEANLGAGNGVLSHTEMVLPKQVVHACIALSQGIGAEFITVDKLKGTTSRMRIFKQLDDSVKINLTVYVLKMDEVTSHLLPEHILIHSMASTTASSPGVGELAPASCETLRVSASCSTQPGFLEGQPPISQNKSVSVSGVTTNCDQPLEACATSSPQTTNIEPASSRSKQLGPTQTNVRYQHSEKRSPESLNECSSQLSEEATKDKEELKPDVSVTAAHIQHIGKAEGAFISGITGPSDQPQIKSTDYKSASQLEANRSEEHTSISNSYSDLKAACAVDTQSQVCGVNTSTPKQFSTQTRNKQPILAISGKKLNQERHKKQSVVSEPRYRTRHQRKCRMPKRFLDSVVLGSEMKFERDNHLENKEIPDSCDADMEPGAADVHDIPSEESDIDETEPENIAHKMMSEEATSEGIRQFIPEDDSSVIGDPMAACGNEPKDFAAKSGTGPVVTTVKSEMGVLVKQNTKSRALKDRSQMKRPHYRREQNVSCSLCGVRLKNIDSVFDHVKLKHSSDDARYEAYLKEIRHAMRRQCDICHKWYTTTDQLRIHINVIHKQHQQAQCPECGVVVKSEAHLKNHMYRLHKHKGQDHLCHLCPARFKTRAYLNSHIKFVHPSKPEMAKCDICNKTYPTFKYMQNHRLRVHGEKRFSCDQCGKAFPCKSNVRRHVLLVHQQPADKPFECEHCGKKFTMKCNMKEHVLAVHLKSFNFQCSICNSGFRRKRELQSHINNAHKVALMNSGLDCDSTVISTTLVTADQLSEATLLDMQQLTEPVEQPDEQTQGMVVDAEQIVLATSNVDPQPGYQYIVATPELLKAFGIKMDK